MGVKVRGGGGGGAPLGGRGVVGLGGVAGGGVGVRGRDLGR